MDFAFSEEQDEFREVLRRFFSEKAPSAEVRRMVELPGGHDPALWKQMGEELGLPGVHLPEAYGGQGFGFLELGIVLEEMGRVVLPSPLFASSVLAAGAIVNAGSEDDKQRLLPAIASGDEIATLAVAEAGGWGATGITCEARAEGDAVVLDGAKVAVPNADAATRLVVAARLPGTTGDAGVTLATLGTADEGVSVEAAEGIDPTRRFARIRFDGARARPLGAPGEAAAALERTLREGAVVLSCDMLGGAQAALDMAVAYAKERVQFARPIGSFQAIKHKAADVLVALERARSLAYWALWVADEQGEELAEAAHLAKSAAAAAYARSATECVQIHGGIGFTWEHDAQLHYKRARSGDILLGDAAAHRQALADELGV